MRRGGRGVVEATVGMLAVRSKAEAAERERRRRGSQRREPARCGESERAARGRCGEGCPIAIAMGLRAR
eukprot:2094997-Pleurochrysis_carterae.AAC.1